VSHVHHIAGQTNAAAEYQAYLDRMRAAAQARENEEVSKRTRAKAFDRYVDAEEEPAGRDDPQERHSPSEDPAADEDDPEPPAGGARYA
jgi:hypothetical protein